VKVDVLFNQPHRHTHLRGSYSETCLMDFGHKAITGQRTDRRFNEQYDMRKS